MTETLLRLFQYLAHGKMLYIVCLILITTLCSKYVY